MVCSSRVLFILTIGSIYSVHVYSYSLVPDAEVMCVVSEVISELPGLQEVQYNLVIGHTSLLASILSHCSIPMERHHELWPVLHKVTVSDLVMCVPRTLNIIVFTASAISCVHGVVAEYINNCHLNVNRLCLHADDQLCVNSILGIKR